MTVQKQDPMGLNGFITDSEYLDDRSATNPTGVLCGCTCNVVYVGDNREEDPLLCCVSLLVHLLYFDDRSEIRSNGVLFSCAYNFVYLGGRSETRSNWVLYCCTCNCVASWWPSRNNIQWCFVWC